MSDYIIQMKVDELKPHPINETIYTDNPSALEELKHSIELNGLLEPITINKGNVVISGHRRMKACKEIGFDKVDCRLSEFDNEIIAIVSLNTYRQKTPSELAKEAEILKTEYSKYQKIGRPKKGEKRTNNNWSIVSVSENLGCSTTKIKKLLSIKNYEPELLKKCDLGLISVEKAYQLVREKYIVDKGGVDYPTQKFKYQLKRLLNKYNPDMEDVLDLVSNHYSGK